MFASKILLCLYICFCFSISQVFSCKHWYTLKLLDFAIFEFVEFQDTSKYSANSAFHFFLRGFDIFFPP